MTDEQIKQNAYEYLANLDRSGVLLTGNEIYLAFIAGAHSRDEEIKSLEKNYREEFDVLKEELESLRKGFYERGDKLKELMFANNKLRNPWKSATKQLPPQEDREDSDFSIDCLVLASDGSSFFEVIAWYDHKSKCWVEKRDVDQRHTDGFKVYYWMELPKCNHVETEGNKK